MKKYSLVRKLMFFINSVFATVLLLSYVLPFLSPKTIPTLAVFSLFVPLLVILNIAFFIYWLLKLHKNALLSLLILVVGYFLTVTYTC